MNAVINVQYSIFLRMHAMAKILNIGLLTRLAEGNYNGTLINSIDTTIKSYGANLFIINTYMIERFCSYRGENPAFFRLAFNHIDGWIILDSSISDSHINYLKAKGRPLVLIGFRPDKYKDCSVVLDDSYYGGETSTHHLISHGHRKIAFLSYSKIYDVAQRFEGYKNALQKNDIAYDPNLFIESHFITSYYAKAAVFEKLNNGVEFTALVSGNDYMAFGAVEALKEFGLKVPEEVAVIGYDNCLHAKSFSPSLSSMHQNIDSLGKLAVEKLINSIIDNTTPSGIHLVRPSLILRNSCGCSIADNDLNIPKQDILDHKDMIIESLEQSIGNAFVMASKLLSANLGELDEIMQLFVSNFDLKCIGYWNEIQQAETSERLIIRKIIDEHTKTVINDEIVCTPDNFPPKEFFSHMNDSSCNQVIWLLPVSTLTKDWCIISYMAPVNYITSSFAYDSSVTLYNLIGIFLDREMANSELKYTLEKLNETLETLQKTQSQLIQSEKMAALGSLVAGVSHEINTPVGISITANSFIQEHCNKLKELYISGKLKRHDMDNFFKKLDETSNVLASNLNKASNLINNFKEIAVDQSTETKRAFKIGAYIKQVLDSLKPTLKDNNISINLECNGDYEIFNYPGGIFKIISNLVENSVIHGYNNSGTGTISIDIKAAESTLHITYSDDGKGVAALDKIFEPFYTTKRGEGRTGLGLNIVYNIITRDYGGSIECKSSTGKGCLFIIRIPL